MIAMLPVSARIYAGFLSLYPAELRRDFGEEMMQVFVDDLEDSYRNCGVAGAARIWWSSVKELLRIALPVHAAKREIAVPLIVFVLTEIDMIATLLTACREGAEPVPASFGQVILVASGLLMFSLLPALTAWVALCVGNHSVPRPLILRPK